MGNVYFAGDAHFGHRGISNKFRKEFESDESHDALILENCRSVLNKRDILFCMGDWVLSEGAIAMVDQIHCRKYLVRGNHDKVSTELLYDAFDEIYGILTYKSNWLSHAPIHPQELFGRRNIHGHCHNNTVPDPRYANVSMENIGYIPILFADILEWFKNEDASVPLTEFNSNAHKAKFK